MSSLFARSSEFLARQLSRGATPAGQVTYIRKVGGSETDLTDQCWVGETTFTRQPADNGPALSFNTRDYLIPVSLLVGPPVRGDRIEEDVGETSPKVWEVMTDVGFDCWSYSDRAQTIYRVHCKRISG